MGKTVKKQASGRHCQNEAKYAAGELAKAADKIFDAKVTPDCVMAAFKQKGLGEASVKDAKTIVRNFINKEVN